MGTKAIYVGEILTEGILSDCALDLELDMIIFTQEQRYKGFDLSQLILDKSSTIFCP